MLLKERQGSPWAEGEGRKKHPRGISLFVRAEIPSVAAKKRRPWHGTSLDCQPAFFPFLSRLTDSLCNSRNGGLLDPPPPPPPLQDVLEFNCFKVVETPDDGGPKRRGREKRRLFPPLSSSFTGSFFFLPSFLLVYVYTHLCSFLNFMCIRASSTKRGFKLAQKTAVRGKAGYTRSNDQRK